MSQAIDIIIGMRYLFSFCLACLWGLAACQPAPQAPAAPTVITHPSATPGLTVRGFLPTPNRANIGLLPSEAEPSPTPQVAVCPASSTFADIAPLPDSLDAQ